MVLQVGAVRHELPAALSGDREALHAQATQAEVALEYAPGQLRIEVSDNGHGAARSGKRGHGLVGIHQRVKLYGGEMTTATANGGGFSLTACLPLAGYRS
jgi:signal transduction histidine kinase